MTILGSKPQIIGANGWLWHDVVARQFAFKKLKDIGITKIRLMNVLSASDDWSALDEAIDIIEANDQQVILCLGDLGAPYSEATEAAMMLFHELLLHLIAQRGEEYVNTLQFELLNEYGGANVTDWLDAYFDTIATINQLFDVTIQAIVPAMQRENYFTLDKVLAYCQEKHYALAGISVHFYHRGVSGDMLDHKDWLARVEQIIAAHNYQALPLYVTEFNLDGMTNDADLKSAYNAAWLASRLVKHSFYNSRAEYFFCGAYGQGFTATGGWQGLYVGYGGSEAAYPVARVLELEQMLQGQLTLIDGAQHGVDGVIDEQGTILISALYNHQYYLNYPVSDITPFQIAIIDATHGNSEYQMNKMNTTNNQGYWLRSQKHKDMLAQFSNPWNDPETGEANAVVTPVNNVLTYTLEGPCVIMLKKVQNS